MLTNIKAIYDRVEAILAKSELSRDSDKHLWVNYLCCYHGLKTRLGPTAFHAFTEILFDKETPVMESVSRARRLIQAKGNYPGKLRNQRLQEADEVSQNINDIY